MSEEIKSEEANFVCLNKSVEESLLDSSMPDIVDWQAIAKDVQEKYDKLSSTVKELIRYDLSITDQDLLVMAFGLSPNSPQSKKFLSDKKYISHFGVQLSSYTAKKLVKCGIIEHDEKLMKIFNAREDCFSNVKISTIKNDADPIKPELSQDNKELVGKKEEDDNQTKT